MNKYVNLLLDELSGKIAKEYTLDIARYHRVQGSPGFHEASLYVQKQLEKIGLDKITIEQYPADGKTMYWSHPAIISWWATKAEIRMVEPKNLVLGRYDEQPLCLATHSNSADVTAEVVDVGSGTKDEDYEGKDVAGKIAIVYGGARSSHVKAVEHGALGTIHHPPWNRASKYPELVQYNGIWPDQTTRDKVTFGFCINDQVLKVGSRRLPNNSFNKVGIGLDIYRYIKFMPHLKRAIFFPDRAPPNASPHLLY